MTEQELEILSMRLTKEELDVIKQYKGEKSLHQRMFDNGDGGFIIFYVSFLTMIMLRYFTSLHMNERSTWIECVIALLAIICLVSINSVANAIQRKEKLIKSYEIKLGQQYDYIQSLEEITQT